MSKKKRKPGIGDLVEVKWLDAGTYTNRPLSDVKGFVAVNIGYLVVDTKQILVLRTGVYIDADLDKDPCGDYTVIPKAWSDEITVIKETDK